MPLGRIKKPAEHAGSERHICVTDIAGRCSNYHRHTNYLVACAEEGERDSKTQVEPQEFQRMTTLRSGDTHFSKVVVRCMNAPEKHYAMLQAMRPIANKFYGNEPHYRCCEQAQDRLGFKAKRKSRGLPYRCKEI